MSSNTPDNQAETPMENVVTLPVQTPKVRTEDSPSIPENSPGLMVLKQDSASVLSEAAGADREPDQEPDPEEMDYLTSENTPENALATLFFPCNRSEFSLIVASVGSFTLCLFVLIGLLKPFPAVLCVVGLLVSDAMVTGRTKGWFSNTLKFWFRKRPKKTHYQRIFDRNTAKAATQAPTEVQKPLTRPNLKPVE
ncbi:MAG: hypothetical protein K2X01_00620 [Cyanobacteria bacterium]|nr:hypothetical protein [Cyanobacteriota bacterium]